MKRFISEPLVQFFVLGSLLFFFISFVSPSQMRLDTQRDIIVDEAALKEYVQFQRKSFDAESASELLDSLSNNEKQVLLDNYVRDEALYREALSLGLNANDEIIRRRLIQKMEYIAQGFYNEVPPLTENDLLTYFEENKKSYRVESSITFTHVFISLEKYADSSPSTEPEEVAIALLSELNKNAVTFNEAGRHGDRFLYNLNYVERTPSYVASHFGRDFEDKLFDLSVSELWQGPIRSQYGWHLVMLKDKADARNPALEEVAQIVLADMQRDQQRQAKARAINKLVEKYNVQLSLPRKATAEE